MLYWGEGAKNKNALKLATSDPDMLRFFTKFLRQSLLVDEAQMTIRINCYLNNGIEIADIELYWLNVLDVSKQCLGTTLINKQPRSSLQKGRKLLYGTCEVAVHSTRLVQHIFGAIQEYTGIEKPEWLM
jgi:hypothetical protein